MRVTKYGNHISPVHIHMYNIMSSCNGQLRAESMPNWPPCSLLASAPVHTQHAANILVAPACHIDLPKEVKSRQTDRCSVIKSKNGQSKSRNGQRHDPPTPKKRFDMSRKVS